MCESENWLEAISCKAPLSAVKTRYVLWRACDYKTYTQVCGVFALLLLMNISVAASLLSRIRHISTP